jgi:teichuronic acid biosynthesis glycosyltransferase TuaH
LTSSGTADHHLIWMAGVSWDGIPGTDRRLATAMTRHVRILWVDPPVSLMRPSHLHGSSNRPVRPRISAIDDRLTRLTPMALPGLTRFGIRATTAPLLRSQVRWALHRLGVRPFAAVATHLDDVLGYWGNGVVDMLYGTDDYVAGARLMRLSENRLRKQEIRALDRADVVAAVSPQLRARWAGLGANPTLIPNGCCLPTIGADDIPPDVRGMTRPVVGLVGQLSERLDLNLLEAVADAGFSLIVVGPRDPRWEQQRFAALVARPKVCYAGRVPADAVPPYLTAMDVGITPYRDTAFNRASFPLKTLEYLGAGRPVVSTDLPAARWLRADLASAEPADAEKILALANDPAKFVDALRRLTVDQPVSKVAGRDPILAAQSNVADLCRVFAARHSWTRRADALAAAIGLPIATST